MSRVFLSLRLFFRDAPHFSHALTDLPHISRSKTDLPHISRSKTDLPHISRSKTDPPAAQAKPCCQRIRHLLFERSPSSLQTGRWTDICLRNPEAKPQSSCPCSPVLQPEWLPPLMLRRMRYLRGYLRCVQTLFPL